MENFKPIRKRVTFSKNFTILAVWMQTEKYYGTWSCIDGEENSEGAAVPITEEEEPCYPYKPTCK